MANLTAAQCDFLAKCQGEGNIERPNNATVLALRARGLIEKTSRASPSGNWWILTSAGRTALPAPPAAAAVKD